MPRALIVTGLLYGDEGKGSIVDHLVRRTEARLVVRHNGGAQAAHNVVLSDGRHHTFSQWGAGTFAGARTFLSQHMITHPLAMVNEATHLREVGISDPWDLMMVDERALVITPYHQAANRIREQRRGDARHGSCGMGVGETYEDRGKPHALRFGDLSDGPTLIDRLHAVRAEKMSELDIGAMQLPELVDVAHRLKEVHSRVQVLRAGVGDGLLRSQAAVVFEGAQGVLLDQFRGVQPYTTWSNTTSENALAMLAGLDFDVTKIGVLRPYVTRHGAGPLATYDELLTLALPDVHNRWNDWQRSFRCGRFDAELARAAIDIEGGIDQLALTNVDRMEALGHERVVAMVEAGLGMKASIISRGPTADHKETR